jgi:DNA-binding transcriptional LysR family regulator
MELRHLRYFIAVAEELHFTRAAERLHIGQPPLSQAILKLEEDVGARLFARTKRRVELTEAGKLYLADARRILALSEQAAVTARRAQRGEAGELRVGFTFSIPLTPMFANVINRYRRDYPQVSLSLHELASQRQLEGLERRSIDLGFMRPPEGALPDALTVKTLREDPLMVILPTGHPLAAQESVAMRELASAAFVMYPASAGTGIHPHIYRLCRAAGFVPNVAQEAGEASTIIGLVAAGCGVSVLPRAFERIAMDGVCYRPLSDADAITPLLLASRKDESSPLVAAFLSMVAS